MKLVKVKPVRDGLKVLDKLGRLIPQEGRSLPLDTFLSRLIKEGDLVVVTEEKPKKKKESKEG